MKGKNPIRIGDTFKHDKCVWKVIDRKPGGKIELFCDERSSFLSCYQRTFREWNWERVPVETQGR